MLGTIRLSLHRSIGYTVLATSYSVSGFGGVININTYEEDYTLLLLAEKGIEDYYGVATHYTNIEQVRFALHYTFC